MRLRRDVLDAEDLQPGGLQGADCGLATGSGPLDEHLDLLHAVLVDRLPCAGVRRDLRGERSGLPGSLEADGAGRLPGDYRPILVGQRHDRVVERRLDVGLADRDVLPHATARATSGRLTTGRGHY